jgi:DNA (cytosine-5)-methyltransferase 1
LTATITDLFCGAGGSSIGAEMAGAELRMALNHWERAIETHATNFQHADHDCNDVAALTTAQIRRYPCTDILLASPECTNHSLAKGARRRKPQAASLWEDGPAGDAEQDRSRATMFDVWRFAEQKQIAGRPYKAIVVENVVDAWKWGPNDDGSLFSAWLGFGKALGYQHEIVFLNSMFAGSVPQSRDRMYVVVEGDAAAQPEGGAGLLVRRLREAGRRPPDLEETRATLGPLRRPVFFACPECNGSVLPGVHPAATAIDWSLPAERIGDRDRPLAPNTRKRIRRGLEKLAGSDFAIRLTHGGAPKPLTLPIVTLTQRHDMAMVMPVAGNTFERTPGNRARDAASQPCDTVHGTLDRAMVVPPMGSVTPRDAHAAPAPTQPTTTRPALVMANRANNVPKHADQEPSPPILTGETVGVVMRNNSGGAEMSTPTHEPIRTLTRGCHQSLLIPYASGNAAAAAAESPAPTVTTRDKAALCIPYDSSGQARVAEDEPTQTLTTRDRLAMVVPFTRNGRGRDVDHDVAPTSTAEGPPAVVLGDDDIDDCRFRMFQLHEIAAAMAMTDKTPGTAYEVLGNKRERMAQYGNAVTPPAMELLVGRLLEVIG